MCRKPHRRVGPCLSVYAILTAPQGRGACFSLCLRCARNLATRQRRKPGPGVIVFGDCAEPSIFWAASSYAVAAFPMVWPPGCVPTLHMPLPPFQWSGHRAVPDWMLGKAPPPRDPPAPQRRVRTAPGTGSPTRARSPCLPIKVTRRPPSARGRSAWRAAPQRDEQMTDTHHGGAGSPYCLKNDTLIKVGLRGRFFLSLSDTIKKNALRGIRTFFGGPS